mmetsp:Transcript_2515/g.4295  ORF Transcript_2515/g.4295 Transcript_2515/m.4295 type:complete len:205 (-) Transcript_2515:282-896(-)
MFWSFRSRFKICLRLASFGTGTSNVRGSRRRMALSTLWGRLVAPKTRTPSCVVIPSHKTKNSDLMVALAEFSNPSRGFKKVSSSSMKMMDGASFCARPNVAAISLLDSPNHLSMILESFTSMKMASASLANALASIVFPVPGRPYRSIPLGGWTNLFSAKRSGLLNGKTASCQSSCLMSSSPPMSSNELSNAIGSTTSSAMLVS